MSNPSPLQERCPATPSDWERYYDLRWRVLREPWNQPRGSERDALEARSFHAAIWDGDLPVAGGRLHFNSTTEAQIRYMAVEPAVAGRGLGARVLEVLEAEARLHETQTIVLNSRKAAQGFYERHGYEVVGPAETMFGVIEHVRMEKRLRPL